MDPQQLYRDHQDLIERIIASICRRHCLRGEEEKDFAQEARLKIVENDYEVLRTFRGSSKLSTYLTVVVQNRFRDFRNERLGKWRPSAAAQRLGREAVQLETLLFRDGHGLEEARRFLLDRHGTRLSEEEVSRILAALPARTRRRFEDDTALKRMPAAEPADRLALDRERAEAAARLEQALAEAIAELPEEDRLLLRLHYQNGLTIAAIARCEGLGEPQRRLYSRRERCQKRLRFALETRGFDRRQVLEVLEWEGSAELRANCEEDSHARPAQGGSVR